MQIIVLVSIYIVAICIAGLILFSEKQNYRKYSIFFLLCFVFALYFYKLKTFPNIFIDEANGFYDTYSLVNYGVDSHLMKLPVYFQSFAGQGQSVLLAYIAVPFFKLLGASIFSFRLTLVVVGIIGILFSCYVLNKYYPKYLAPIMLPLCTAPYLFIETRYAMDCNISLWVMLIAINFLIIGFNCQKPIVPLTLFYLFSGLIAYSYNVAWIYLIFFIIGISTLIYREKVLRIKVIILELGFLLVELIPILIFAIRSNIDSLNRTIKFGIFTIPELPISRANSSFINFHGNIFKNIIINIFSGFKMLFLTSDGLTWNSIPNFNAYYPFAILIFIIGFYWTLKNYRLVEPKILLVLLFSNIPIWLIVQPNYNHWIFSHIPILLIIGVGIEKLRVIIPYKYIYSMYFILFLLFIHSYYTMPRYTGFDISSIKNVKYVQQASEGKNVYFDGDDRNLLLVIRNFSGISPYEFQRTKDNPYSRKKLLFYDNMANYHKVDAGSDIRKGELFLTTNRNMSKKEFRLQKSNIYIGDTLYYLYRKNN